MFGERESKVIGVRRRLWGAFAFWMDPVASADRLFSSCPSGTHNAKATFGAFFKA
jgi:hypothetical protein